MTLLEKSAWTQLRGVLLLLPAHDMLHMRPGTLAVARIGANTCGVRQCPSSYEPRSSLRVSQPLQMPVDLGKADLVLVILCWLCYLCCLCLAFALTFSCNTSTAFKYPKLLSLLLKITSG